ncbi:uncharacterized protein LOC110454245 isoform X2 [Mizuhopecten yessoensis]|nr:uncharacterized protein LOC110454245 isoform X2 [Mizuhopecten yessoensis]XP_021359338.1 uncharacterized protein LOC110454245 isoform X2 [Mizuhopecten yessoensis]XP_021359339.1 uncharacterized protein LOC110454245 isoform X2 [Mizuhopecten yessoensis]XP_021359340.1 uncharacterized protein LOC110454245 isoform X2 [Mizuhopecten yessoensis]
MATPIFPLLPIPCSHLRSSNRKRAETARIREKWFNRKDCDVFGEHSDNIFRTKLLPPSLIRRQLTNNRNVRSATSIEWVRKDKPEVARWKKDFEEKFKNQVSKKATTKRLNYARVLYPTTPPQLKPVTDQNESNVTLFYTTNTRAPPRGISEMRGRYIVAPGWCSEHVSWQSSKNDKTLLEMHRHSLF